MKAYNTFLTATFVMVSCGVAGCADETPSQVVNPAEGPDGGASSGATSAERSTTEAASDSQDTSKSSRGEGSAGDDSTGESGSAADPTTDNSAPDVDAVSSTELVSTSEPGLSTDGSGLLGSSTTGEGVGSMTSSFDATTGGDGTTTDGALSSAEPMTDEDQTSTSGSPASSTSGPVDTTDGSTTSDDTGTSQPSIEPPSVPSCSQAACVVCDPATPIVANIATNTVWSSGICVLGGDIKIEKDVTLTIADGVIVKSGYSRGNAYRPLTVEGTLNVAGTGSGVVFTSSWDDFNGGDLGGAGASVGLAGDWGGLSFKKGSSGTLYGARIYYAGTALTTDEAAPKMVNLTAEKSSVLASSGVMDQPEFQGLVASGNTWNGMIRRAGTITKDTRWDQAEIVHNIGGEIIVGEDATLTIGRGLLVKAGYSRGNAFRPLIVNGTLNVEGTQHEPAVFTSYWDDAHGDDTNSDGGSTGAASDWGGIVFNKGSSGTIRYAEIYYAGTAITTDEAAPRIEYLRAEGNAAVVSAMPMDEVIVKQPQVKNNSWNGLIRRPGTIIRDTTWSQADIVHNIGGEVIVGEDAVLTIGQGVIVKAGYSRGDAFRPLIVDGTLDVAGTEQAPAIFTSYWDDSVGGDTNGDGGTVGQKSDWGGIVFNQGSSGSVNYAEIYYASSGITVTRSAPSITNTLIKKNATGISATGEGAAPQVRSSCIVGNTAGVSSTATAAVDAINNWWDSATGPSGSGAGSGQSVTTGVTFDPFLTACPL